MYQHVGAITNVRTSQFLLKLLVDVPEARDSFSKKNRGRVPSLRQLGATVSCHEDSFRHQVHSPGPFQQIAERLSDERKTEDVFIVAFASCFMFHYNNF
jgi:hypothetical protein